IRVDAVAVVKFNADGERFTGNNFTAVGNSVEAQANHQGESGINFVPLAANARGQRSDWRGKLRGKRRHRDLIELLSSGDQGVGGGLVIEAQGGVARGHERSVNGAHEGIDTSIAYFKVFIERAQRLVKRGRIEFAAIFALESDGTAEKWRVQESGDALRTMIGEGVQTDLSPGFSVERRDII